MISLFLHLLFSPAWEFLSNKRMTLAHVRFCLQFLVHLLFAVWKRTAPNKKESTLYLVQTKASEVADFPGVNTPLDMDLRDLLTCLLICILYGVNKTRNVPQ